MVPRNFLTFILLSFRTFELFYSLTLGFLTFKLFDSCTL